MKKLFLSLALTVAIIAGGLASFNPDVPSASDESQTPQEQSQTDTGPQGQMGASVDQGDGSSTEVGESSNSGKGPPTLVPEGSIEGALGGLRGQNSSTQSGQNESDQQKAREQTRDNYNAVLGEDQSSERMSAEEYNRRVDTLYQQQRGNYDGGS